MFNLIGGPGCRPAAPNRKKQKNYFIEMAMICAIFMAGLSKVFADPTVTSITRLDPNPTSATQVAFQVNYSEPVIHVDLTDFVTSGTSVPTGAATINFTHSSAVSTIIINTGAGDGDIRLDIQASMDITNSSGVGLSNVPFVSGESYTIDKTAPTVAETTPPDLGGVASLASISVRFTEAVSGVTADLLTVNSQPATTVSTSDNITYVFGGFPVPAAPATVNVALSADGVRDQAHNSLGDYNWTFGLGAAGSNVDTWIRY